MKPSAVLTGAIAWVGECVVWRASSASRREGLKGRACDGSGVVEIELRSDAFSTSAVLEGSFSRSAWRGVVVAGAGLGCLMAVAEWLG